MFINETPGIIVPYFGNALQLILQIILTNYYITTCITCIQSIQIITIQLTVYNL